MEKIRLLCKTRGFDFGTTLEIGSKVGQISKKDAESLIDDSLAQEVEEVVDGTNVTLNKEIEELKAENAALKAEIEKLSKPAEKKESAKK